MQPVASTPSKGAALAPGIRPYQRQWLTRDVVAGATLAAVAIPEGLGYAKIAGMPPETGLYTCLLPRPGLRALRLDAPAGDRGRLGDGRHQRQRRGAAGPGQPEDVLLLTCLLAIMSGVLLILAGWLQLGFLSDFMSRSVLAGFLTGVGIQIAVGQLDGMLGVHASGDTTWQKFVSTLSQVPDASSADVLLSLAVIVTILGLGRVSPRIPGPLIAVVGSIVLASTLDWEERRGIEMVGALPGGLPTLQVPSASLADTLALVPHRADHPAGVRRAERLDGQRLRDRARRPARPQP